MRRGGGAPCHIACVFTSSETHACVFCKARRTARGAGATLRDLSLLKNQKERTYWLVASSLVTAPHTAGPTHTLTHTESISMWLCASHHASPLSITHSRCEAQRAAWHTLIACPLAHESLQLSRRPPTAPPKTRSKPPLPVAIVPTEQKAVCSLSLAPSRPPTSTPHVHRKVQGESSRGWGETRGGTHSVTSCGGWRRDGVRKLKKGLRRDEPCPSLLTFATSSVGTNLRPWIESWMAALDWP